MTMEYTSDALDLLFFCLQNRDATLNSRSEENSRGHKLYVEITELPVTVIEFSKKIDEESRKHDMK